LTPSLLLNNLYTKIVSFTKPHPSFKMKTPFFALAGSLVALIGTLTALVGLLATTVSAVAVPYLPCAGLYESPLCCKTDVLGVVWINCSSRGLFPFSKFPRLFKLRAREATYEENKNY
jgi:hypothetical protein